MDADKEVNLVLSELFDSEQSTAQELADGRVTVSAFKAIDPGKTPLWTINAVGISGEVFDFGLYKVSATACCDTSKREFYYSLRNGKEVLTSTEPIASLEYAGTHEKRYVGYDDGFGNSSS